MEVKLVSVGFGNSVALNRVVALVTPDSAPIKRMIRQARDRSSLVDLTCGRKTKAVIVLDSGHVVLAAIQPELIANRLDHDREAVIDSSRA